MDQIETNTEETTLTRTDLDRAATNDPALSQVEFTLGDRTFKIVDLPYRDYLAFLAQFQPLLSVLLGVLGKDGVNIGGLPEFNAATLITYCSDSLPELVRIICKQTDPDITVEDVMALGKSPFRLAAIVLKQVEQNRMIQEITDFFAQTLKLMGQKKSQS